MSSPLMISVAKGHLEVAKLLLAHEADPYQLSNIGFTPIVWATCFNDSDFIKLFIAHDPKLLSDKSSESINTLELMYKQCPKKVEEFKSLVHEFSEIANHSEL